MFNVIERIYTNYISKILDNSVKDVEPGYY